MQGGSEILVPELYSLCTARGSSTRSQHNEYYYCYGNYDPKAAVETAALLAIFFALRGSQEKKKTAVITVYRTLHSSVMVALESNQDRSHHHL